MILINVFFSFISHRLYIYIRSRNSNSFKRVFIWNAHRLEYLVYLLAYIVLIVSVTVFVIFTTQIRPSENCGPFRQFNSSYEVVELFLNDYQTSVILVSIINFLTSPGFIYFLSVTFFVIAYKLRHEQLAEKKVIIKFQFFLLLVSFSFNALIYLFLYFSLYVYVKIILKVKRI